MANLAFSSVACIGCIFALSRQLMNERHIYIDQMFLSNSLWVLHFTAFVVIIVHIGDATSTEVHRIQSN